MGIPNSILVEIPADLDAKWWQPLTDQECQVSDYWNFPQSPNAAPGEQLLQTKKLTRGNIDVLAIHLSKTQIPNDHPYFGMNLMQVVPWKAPQSDAVLHLVEDIESVLVAAGARRLAPA